MSDVNAIVEHERKLWEHANPSPEKEEGNKKDDKPKKQRGGLDGTMILFIIVVISIGMQQPLIGAVAVLALFGLLAHEKGLIDKIKLKLPGIK